MAKEKKTNLCMRIEESILQFLDSMVDGIKIQDRTSALRNIVVDSKGYQEWKRRRKE